jgi:apolipoprotein N-acyltransferase
MSLIVHMVIVGLAIALAPLPILTFILTLASRRGRAGGWAFLFGWLLSLVVVMWVAVAITGGQGIRANTSPNTVTFAIYVALGVGLVVYGYRRRRKEQTSSAVSGRLTGRIESINLWGALALGMLIQPWVLVAAGATAIAQAKLAAPTTVIAMSTFCILASSVLLAIQLYGVRYPKDATERLAKLRSWLERHSDPVVVWASFIVGMYLMGKGFYGLA